MGALEFVERLPAFEEEISERWLVRDTPAAPPHVLAVIDNDDREWMDRVERATRPWVGFVHPAVTTVRSLVRADGRLVITTDDDRGPAMGPAIAHLTDVPAERAAWAITQLLGVAEGLVAMARHEPGFVHRRIGPPYLVVTATGGLRLRPPIAHVGLGPRRAYMGAGTISGATRWLSPEQILGQPLTPASDVFQLATTLYTAIAGHAPFGTGDDIAMLQAIVRAPAPEPPAGVPPALGDVIVRGLERSLDARHPDVPAFARDLHAAAPSTTDAVARERLVAWWPTAPGGAAPIEFIGQRCGRRWEELTVGERDDIRHCASCNQPVVRVSSLDAVIPLLGKHCLAYDRR